MKITISILLSLFFSQLHSQGWGFQIDQINSFQSTQFGNAEFSDIDGDSDPDLLITGETFSDDIVIVLYENDGSGIFTEKPNDFEAVTLGAIAFADVDGDGDEDVLLAGRTDTKNASSQLYLNDGTGSYTLKSNTSFVPILQGSVVFEDIDGDNDQDVIISGIFNDSVSISEPTTKIYTNDGTGTFTEANTAIVSLISSSVAFADVDGDMDPDLMITGYVSWSDPPVAKLYLNDGDGQFVESTSNDFFQMGSKGLAFADIDNDQDLDLCIIGSSNTSSPVTKLYFNDGQGNFTEDPLTILIDVRDGTVDFADLNGDGDIDLIQTGWDGNQAITKTYINIGGGKFWLNENTLLRGIQFGDVAVADIDGDNDSDFFAIGSLTNFLYINLSDPISSIGNPLDAIEYIVGPNPVNQTLMVNVNTNVIDRGQICIYNLNSQLVLEKEMLQETELNVSSLPEGSYHLIIHQNGKISHHQTIAIAR